LHIERFKRYSRLWFFNWLWLFDDRFQVRGMVCPHSPIAGVNPLKKVWLLTHFQYGRTNEPLERQKDQRRKYFSVSGNGFKLSPLVGQWMAQLILTGNKPDNMEHFAFDRFARGAEIRPRYSSGVLG
jgi:hypothetical protein